MSPKFNGVGVVSWAEADAANASNNVSELQDYMLQVLVQLILELQARTERI